jgi:hypothetical protein
LFDARARRERFRRYLEGLLLPTRQNKTLTLLTNTEPVVGAQRKEAQSLQWFLSEPGWDPKRSTSAGWGCLLDGLKMAPSEPGVPVSEKWVQLEPPPRERQTRFPSSHR